MKLFGHPLHLMLVHFPAALFPMDLVCSFIAWWKGDASFATAAFYAGAGGVGLGALAVITGLFDLVPLSKTKPGSLNKAFLHGGLNTVVMTGFAVTTFIAYKSYPLVVVTPVAIVSKSAMVAMMLVGNYLGGALVLKDRVV